jgi:hypothetical protein
MIRPSSADDRPEPQLSFRQRLQRTERHTRKIMEHEARATTPRALDACFLLEHARLLRLALTAGDALAIAEHAAAVGRLELKLLIYEYEPWTRRGRKDERERKDAGQESGSVRLRSANDRKAKILEKARECKPHCKDVASVIARLRRLHPDLLVKQTKACPEGRPISDRSLYTYLESLF